MQPKTTNEFLDAIAAKEGGCSDYRLAKILECSQQVVSSYRHKGVAFGDEIAIRAANILELDPAYVVMCVHKERAKTEGEKALWSSMLERLGGLAAAILLAPALLMAPTESHANTTSYDSRLQVLTVIRSGRRGNLASILAALFGHRTAAP